MERCLSCPVHKLVILSDQGRYSEGSPSGAVLLSLFSDNDRDVLITIFPGVSLSGCAVTLPAPIIYTALQISVHMHAYAHICQRRLTLCAWYYKVFCSPHT